MITGYDGIPEAVNHQPHIATAGRDITEVTRQVFDILKELFDGKTFPDNYIHKIDANLQLYGSCGCREKRSRIRMLWFIRCAYGRQR